MNYEHSLCKICSERAKCEKIPLIEPLSAPKCPYTIKVSIFKIRQCRAQGYYAFLGSY